MATKTATANIIPADHEVVFPYDATLGRTSDTPIIVRKGDDAEIDD